MTLAEQITSAVSTATNAERCRVLVEELPGMLKAERDRVLDEVDALASEWDKRSEPPEFHRCPDYESCIECPVFASFEYRAEELRALAAKMRTP